MEELAVAAEAAIFSTLVSSQPECGKLPVLQNTVLHYVCLKKISAKILIIMVLFQRQENDFHITRGEMWQMYNIQYMRNYNPTFSSHKLIQCIST